ncbi:hypothetical protein [Paraburkholderia unamae]|uniref:Uncharacterized protein n=1 Tax=Paraburkholderia unamae TaxID=219649 RepID=A0ACC6RXZ7_9BURK
MSKPPCIDSSFYIDKNKVLGAAFLIAVFTAIALTQIGKGGGFVGVGVPGATAFFIALLSVMIIASHWSDLCSSAIHGGACVAGVVQQIVPAPNGLSVQLMPWLGQHDRVDVVVRSDFWPVLTLPSNNFNDVNCGPDVDRSPFIFAYFHNSRVCAGALGSVIGGAVGGIAAAIAVAVLIGGCLTVFLCLLALLVAALIAIAGVLVGAFVGGQIAQAIAGHPAPPSADGAQIMVGDYVSFQGSITGDATDSNVPSDALTNHTRVFWFVEHAALHGHSLLNPPFSFSDPDQYLLDSACDLIRQVVNWR